MTERQSAFQWEGDKLHIAILLQPRASRDEWLGLHGEAFRVRITAPPVDGKANAHLIKFLAKTFGCQPLRDYLAVRYQCPPKAVYCPIPTKPAQRYLSLAR